MQNKNWALFVIPLILIVFFNASAAEKEKNKDLKSLVEKEGELLNFDSIKDVLKNDMLAEQAGKKKAKISNQVKKIKKDRGRKYRIPKGDAFWSFFSEYWVVKNAPMLKWNFKKPDYGLDTAFEMFLEKLGFYEKKFKILLLNTPNVPHFGLPSGGGDDYILLLSVPFIRTLDLSKLEISLLMLEDFLRIRNGYFQKAVATKELNKYLGTNFHKSEFNSKIFKKVLSNYDEFVFKKGFDFKEQFEITTQMGAILKSNLAVWNSYMNLLKKIDQLVKTNLLYKYYTRMYPSPELQINWLRPKRKGF